MILRHVRKPCNTAGELLDYYEATNPSCAGTGPLAPRGANGQPEAVSASGNELAGSPAKLQPCFSAFGSVRQFEDAKRMAGRCSCTR